MHAGANIGEVEAVCTGRERQSMALRELKADAPRLGRLEMIAGPAAPIARGRVVPIPKVKDVQAHALPLRADLDHGHPARSVLLLNLHHQLIRGRPALHLEGQQVMLRAEQLLDLRRQITIPAWQVFGRETETLLALRSLGGNGPGSRRGRIAAGPHPIGRVHRGAGQGRVLRCGAVLRGSNRRAIEPTRWRGPGRIIQQRATQAKHMTSAARERRERIAVRRPDTCGTGE